jgi:integrase
VNLEHAELRIAGRRTKNGDQKVLHIGDDLLAILKAQPRICDRVFTDIRRPAAAIRCDSGPLPKACRKAGIKDGFTDANGKPRQPGFHDLRRTFARMANRAGIAHRDIMEIAGWKSEAMLLRYLGVSKPAEQRAAFNVLAASIR